MASLINLVGPNPNIVAQMNSWLSTSAASKRAQLAQWPQLNPSSPIDYWQGARSHIVAQGGTDPGQAPPPEWASIFTALPEAMPSSVPSQTAPGTPGGGSAFNLSGVFGWVQKNPLAAAGIGLGLLLVFGKKGRRRGGLF